MNELKNYKKGNWNYATVERQSDGSLLITTHKEGQVKARKCRVKNLYQSNEEELDVESGKPITKRDKRHSLS